MSDQFIGQVMMFAGKFVVRSWLRCDGQLLPISTNNALFSLIGTIYGGDGVSTFALPDMRGRVAVHRGRGPGLSNRLIGQKIGANTVTLTFSQLPMHAHSLIASVAPASSTDPTNAVTASLPNGDGNVFYKQAAAPFRAMASNAIDATGGSQSHQNMMPFQTLDYQIAIYGVYPSRS